MAVIKFDSSGTVVRVGRSEDGAVTLHIGDTHSYDLSPAEAQQLATALVNERNAAVISKVADAAGLGDVHRP